jgi:AcrR family transcriptional regulator
MNTKERLFETALNLFSEKGFKATSIRDITRETGVTVSSFYNHFKSKDELLQAVYDHYTSLYIDSEQAEPDYDKLLDQLSLTDIFTHLTKQYIESMQNEKLMKLTRIIVMEQYTNETAGEIAFKDRRRLLSSMETLFVLLGKKGLIQSKDPQYMGRLMGYVLLGLASDNIYYKFLGQKDLDEIIRLQTEEVTQFIRKALLAEA